MSHGQSETMERLRKNNTWHVSMGGSYIQEKRRASLVVRRLGVHL